MNDWWTENFEQFSKVGYNRADFVQMAIEGKLLFRKGTRRLMQTCHDCNMDFVVMSAGIYEYVESSL